MKPRFMCALLLLALTASPLGAYPSDLVSAFWGKVLLGPHTWSRVVRVENATPTARYPASFHALVFELEGILWFYAESEGTQSLSREVGRIRRDKEEFLQLVGRLSPGFTAVADATGDQPPLLALIENKLPRGCFLYGVLNWRRLEVDQRGLRSSQLLTYYVNTADGLRGHTVLLYRFGRRTFLYDPASEVLERELPPLPTEIDPLTLATQLSSPMQPPVSASLLKLHRTGYRVKEPIITRRSLAHSVVAAAP